MNPTTLMIEDTLRAAERGITTALRQLKDLEAPFFTTPGGKHPGGTHRGHAMVMLRLALHEVHRAVLAHIEESAFRTPIPPEVLAGDGAQPKAGF
jgi:hypothetical protein